MQYITEIDVFWLLDRLRPIATGVDEIPAWFLRPGAPVFAAPLAQLLNQSIIEGFVPHQWKTAVITPVLKVTKPIQPTDFRPISGTPVLSRSLERFIVRSNIYPTFQHPPPGLIFDDQYVFSPSGSTTAALITFFHTVSSMLSLNQFGHVFFVRLYKSI